MFQLKPISKQSIPEALQKAERYRLLNEPHLAQSICQDILEVEPDNHAAVVTMLLSITDQFGGNAAANVTAARQLLPLLKNEYERHYYAGIICERQGSAILNRGKTSDHFAAYEWLSDAMENYEKAEALRPSGNDDALLRWNTCARQIMSHRLQPRQEQFVEPSYD
jgi:hypothetical protein